MTSFYDFVKQEESEPVLALSLPEKSSETVLMVNAIADGVAQFAKNIPLIPANDADRFGQELAELVTDDSFLRDLSDAIQLPRQGETEDVFVLRSKEVLRELIDLKLKSK